MPPASTTMTGDSLAVRPTAFWALSVEFVREALTVLAMELTVSDPPNANFSPPVPPAATLTRMGVDWAERLTLPALLVTVELSMEAETVLETRS